MTAHCKGLGRTLFLMHPLVWLIIPDDMGTLSAAVLAFRGSL